MTTFADHIIRHPVVQIVMKQEPLDWAAAAPAFNELVEILVNRVAGWEHDFEAAFGYGKASDVRFLKSVEDIVSPNAGDFDHDDGHYRLYIGHSDNELVAVCLQYFDYPDYDADRFIGRHYFQSYREAEAAAVYLECLVGGR